MTPKEYLCRYHNILEKISIKKEYIEFCKQRGTSISSPSFDGMPKSPNKDNEAPFVKWLIKRKQAEEDLKNLETKAKEIKFETEQTIISLNNETYEMILIMRYIDWMTWEDIAARLYFSKATIKRKHEKAIECLKKVCIDKICLGV